MNFPSVANFSIAKGTSGTNPPEMYIPLWWWSGSTLTSSTNASGNVIEKGSNTQDVGTSPNSSNKLHTLNSSWKSTLKYAFEVSLAIGSTSATAYAQLWDFTSGTLVSGTQISTTSTTISVLRSAQFTLIPGHVYGVDFWTSSGSYTAQMTDASLIVFPQ